MKKIKNVFIMLIGIIILYQFNINVYASDPKSKFDNAQSSQKVGEGETTVLKANEGQKNPNSNKSNSDGNGGGSESESESQVNSTPWYEDLDWKTINTSSWVTTAHDAIDLVSTDNIGKLQSNNWDKVRIYIKNQSTGIEQDVDDEVEYYHWIIKFGDKENQENTVLEDSHGEKTKSYTAPQKGYYYITSVPVIKRTITKYSYTRKVIYVSDMNDNLLSTSGNEPTYNSLGTEVSEFEQTIKLKTWRIYLDAGQSISLDQNKITEETKVKINPNNYLVK